MSLNKAKNDWNRFLTNGGFAVEATLTPAGGQPVSVNCLAMKHHNSVDTDGMPINSKNVHASFSESNLTGLGLNVRDTNGEVNMRNWILTYPDSSETDKSYIVKETMPDETVGIIVCILGDYGG